MAKRYVIATDEGTHPARPVHSYPLQVQTLAICKKDWPERSWRVFELEYESAIRRIKLDSVPSQKVRANLLSALRESFGHEFKFV